MITSKEDFLYYLRCDKIALGKEYRFPKIKVDIIWKYQILMRKCEYIKNCKKGFFWRLIEKIYMFLYVSLGQKLGFSIGLNIFGPGLSIAHYGNIVVNSSAKIGKNCRIHEGVCIGGNGKCNKVPQIGDNVFIATGAKIIGDVKIANGVCIGANAVVVNDILEPNITVAGVPAKKISNKGSKDYLLIEVDD